MTSTAKSAGIGEMRTERERLILIVQEMNAGASLEDAWKTAHARVPDAPP